jgi:hypothetical protein
VYFPRAVEMMYAGSYLRPSPPANGEGISAHMKTQLSLKQHRKVVVSSGFQSRTCLGTGKYRAEAAGRPPQWWQGRTSSRSWAGRSYSSGRQPPAQLSQWTWWTAREANISTARPLLPVHCSHIPPEWSIPDKRTCSPAHVSV